MNKFYFRFIFDLFCDVDSVAIYCGVEPIPEFQNAEKQLLLMFIHEF